MALIFLLIFPVDDTCMVRTGSSPSGLGPETGFLCLCLLLFCVVLVESLVEHCWVGAQGIVELSLAGFIVLSLNFTGRVWGEVSLCFELVGGVF